MDIFIKGILLAVLAYFIGSISTGVILSYCFGQKNLQKEGSGNIGATNVTRLMGKKWGLLTLAGDTVKGMIPIWLGQWVLEAGSEQFFLYVTVIALSAFFGHLFPIYLHFKGGKGVATALGIFILLAPKALMIAIPLFVLVVLWGKYISLGSIMAALSFPISLILLDYNIYVILMSFIMATAIILKHKENIRRLLKGEEKVWYIKKGVTKDG
jgi:glycerol-3-phosphate acyltransferase PlsY